MFDIVFISYNEPTADANYAKLKERFPLAKRVHGVKGIHQAHIAAAKKAFTKMFWVVDADAVVLDTFKFDYEPADLGGVYVWRSRNPVNDLEYGYGGIKLFPKKLTMDMDTSKPDMTTSITKDFYAMPEVSNITAFNTDPFSTWRSAFRECCKLATIADEEALARLDCWCNNSTDENATKGALAGKTYGQENAGNKPALTLINDFEWLKNQFQQTH